MGVPGMIIPMGGVLMGLLLCGLCCEFIFGGRWYGRCVRLYRRLNGHGFSDRERVLISAGCFIGGVALCAHSIVNIIIVQQKPLTFSSCCFTVIHRGWDMANTLSTDKKIAVIGSLAEGSSIRSIERITGVHRDTIMRLGVKVGRPKLPKGEAKGKIVAMRFDPEELKRIDTAAKANRKSRSEWIRGKLLATEGA